MFWRRFMRKKYNQRWLLASHIGTPTLMPWTLIVTNIHIKPFWRSKKHVKLLSSSHELLWAKYFTPSHKNNSTWYQTPHLQLTWPLWLSNVLHTPSLKIPDQTKTILNRSVYQGSKSHAFLKWSKESSKRWSFEVQRKTPRTRRG